ncbi:MAG TPA: hypothetical protein VHE34_15910 [Puia sp.]|uniref:hypothetical protein n=1 Tax=Puia sp. TaxID=2045100 RepID=UPI002C1FA37E|nr:hypothetical protein [Puia sp.]HVU96715.1 hypothetical protein [Puia sp.]
MKKLLFAAALFIGMTSFTMAQSHRRPVHHRRVVHHYHRHHTVHHARPHHH